MHVSFNGQLLSVWQRRARLNILTHEYSARSRNGNEKVNVFFRRHMQAQSTPVVMHGEKKNNNKKPLKCENGIMHDLSLHSPNFYSATLALTFTASTVYKRNSEVNNVQRLL